MINVRNRPIVNDNNDTNQSIEVKEMRHNTAIQHEGRLINLHIVFNNNHSPGIFGQIERLRAGGWKVIAIRYLMKVIKCLGIMALFLLIILGFIHSASDSSSSNLTGTPYMAVKEKIPCDCSKVIKENQLDIKNNDEVFDETQDVDDSTCTLYDLFLHVFNKLCSLKLGQSGSAADNSFASEFDQDGAVRDKDKHPTNMNPVSQLK